MKKKMFILTLLSFFFFTLNVNADGKKFLHMIGVQIMA